MRKVGLLTLGAFTLGLDAYVMAGVLPVLADDIGTRVSLAGQLVTVFTLAYALSAPLVAGLLSGVRPRALILAALAVFTLGNSATALAPSLGTLLLARGVAGAGAGVYSALSTAAAAALVPPERRGRALALVMGGMSAGTVLGVPIGVLLAEHTGWRATMWLLTGLGAGALAGLAALLPPVPAEPVVPVRARLAALTDRAVAPVVAVSFLAAVASLGLYTYLAPVLAAAGGVGEVAPYLWAWGAGGVLGSVLAGPLVDRTGRARMLTGGVLAVIVPALALLPVLAAAALPGAVVALVAWGAAGWALQVPQQHRLLALRAERGTIALALNNSALYLGSAVGSALGGLALGAGLAPYALPWVAAGVAATGLALHLAAGRRSRVAARVSTLGCYEHS
ncbi:MFS transporter [Streptomyces decoyicus]|uniref:MFS transporter n=1 Tax=Streptomyces decoyicus TaxID=249567 RepID=UPI00069E1425|nr:MFS transporter [Streptomyces decoyicus]KOG40585.1 MFS transporter [Streptomyces decoyicus]QZY20536.1 MFS transporter [Streptomyces decoyicus]